MDTNCFLSKAFRRVMQKAVQRRAEALGRDWLQAGVRQYLLTVPAFNTLPKLREHLADAQAELDAATKAHGELKTERQRRLNRGDSAGAAEVEPRQAAGGAACRQATAKRDAAAAAYRAAYDKARVEVVRAVRSVGQGYGVAPGGFGGAGATGFGGSAPGKAAVAAARAKAAAALADALSELLVAEEACRFHEYDSVQRGVELEILGPEPPAPQQPQMHLIGSGGTRGLPVPIPPGLHK